MGNVTLVAVCGLKREARIVGGPGIVAVAGGGNSAALARQVESAAAGCAGLISIGVAGALDPTLAIGEAVVASAVVAGGAPAPTNAAWTQRLAKSLGDARVGTIASSDTIIAEANDKAALHAASGAIAVDMESHIVAGVAERLGLPFAALRFISDAAADSMPPAALVAMKSDGGVVIGAVLGSLARDPRQLPALMRLGRDADVAFRALRRGRGLLGPALGFPQV